MAHEEIDLDLLMRQVDRVREEYAGSYYIPDAGPYLRRNEHGRWEWCWDTGVGSFWRGSTWAELYRNILCDPRDRRNRERFQALISSFVPPGFTPKPQFGVPGHERTALYKVPKSDPARPKFVGLYYGCIIEVTVNTTVIAD